MIIHSHLVPLVTKRRFRLRLVVGETKRAWLVMIPSNDKTYRLPKIHTDFEAEGGQQFFSVSDLVAEFVGLVEEIHL